jgi:hypothetical protein
VIETMQSGRSLLTGLKGANSVPGHFGELPSLRALLPALAFCLIGFLGAGCHVSGKSESNGFAIVEIHGNTPGQISAVALQVFRENGYLVARTEPQAMTFEKQASNMEAIKYGGWLDAVWARVEVTIVPVAEQTFEVQARVRLLQGRGNFEEEVKHASIKIAPYQQLLTEVAKRLGQKGR